MPGSLATARGESRLTLVRDGAGVAHRTVAPERPASGGRATRVRAAGAIALVAALGTVLLAALAASATLAWAGG